MDVILPANNWRPRHYQARPWEYLQSTPWGARLVLCHHRRAGKDHLSINWTAVASQLRVGLYIHVFPYGNQARRVIWNGIDRNGLPFLSAFPEALIASRNELEMRLKLTNGSVYQVLGADDPDKLVGINCVGAVFSEYALMNPNAFALVQPILAENGGWAIFPSTPRGRNHFHKLIYGADGVAGAMNNPKWHVSIETAHTTGAIREEEIEEVRRSGVEEAIIQQEFYCSFDAPMAGAYYEKQMNRMDEEKRICDVPYDPSLPVSSVWDLGMNDATSIICFQTDRARNIRIIDYMEATNQGLAYYVSELDKKARRGDWVFDRHYGPHDLAVRELGTGKSRLEMFRELGMRFTVLEKENDIRDGIEASRMVLGRTWIDRKLTRLVDCLRNYRKEWDDRLRVYRDKPRHDEYSHGADTFRYLARVVSRNTDQKKTVTSNAEASWNPFAL